MKENIIEYIHSLGFFSKPAGLERIKEVMEKLGNPQNDLKCIHIAGTNGKGSTAAFLASVFEQNGLKTGLFISPFILEFCERISINRRFIPLSELEKLGEKVKKTDVELTEFEFITAVAFLYFSEQNCDIAVIETGLGGRLDATNVISDPLCSVITKIGLDHTAILGDTIEEIAGEKCGIIKSSPVITVPNQESRALEVIRKKAPDVIIPNIPNLEILRVSPNSNEFVYKGETYKTRLWGQYQIYNALTAIETVLTVFPDMDKKILKAGLLKTAFPARLEYFKSVPDIILDGAHNPDGAAALSAVLSSVSGDKTAIVGMMSDKNTDEVLKILLPHFKRIVTVTVEGNPRAMSADDLRRKAEKAGTEAISAKDIAEALELAVSFGDTVFVFGSLYLASAIRPRLLEKTSF